MKLPIDSIRGDFDLALDGANRLVVTAETGAGKSTQIPIWLSEKYHGLILVIEPRRVACHALADFLSAERGQKTGAFFGSRVRFSDRSSSTTRVLYSTPGVALRMLADANASFGAIVVDEFHERSWQMDLVVAAAASLPRFASTPLLLTSATIDAQAAAMALNAKVLHAKGRTFPVAITYQAEPAEPSLDDIGPRAAKAVVAALREHKGDVLVFLPGMKEIRATEAALGRRSEEILIVHGSQPPEAMRRVFSTSSNRRIYLSTNIAETSITLPGVRVVVDSGLARGRIHRGGRAALATQAISNASMDQRAGRAGRVAAGACIRLWSQRFRPIPFQEPEVGRTELDDFLLQAAQLGLPPANFANTCWIDPPPAFAVERAHTRLLGLKALDEHGLTQRGRALADLPVSAEQAALLVGAPPEINATLCDVVAILQARGGFLRPLTGLDAGRQSAVKEARTQLLAGVADEVMTQLKLLREGDAALHHLSARRLKETRAIAKQLKRIVGATGQGTQGLAAFILTRLPESGFVLRPRAQKTKRPSRSQPWSNGQIEVQITPFVPLDPEANVKKPQAGVVFETEWLGSGTRVIGVGRMLLPASLKTLAQAELGVSTITDVKLIKSRSIRVVAVKETQLAGITLASGETKLEGQELCHELAKFILQGRLYRGANESILDALYGWNLLSTWKDLDDLGGYTAPAPPAPHDPEEWLTQRLITLGVESANDIALVEHADIVPVLEAETAIPDWVTQPLLDDFPRLWTHQGAVYTCNVNPAARRVTIEPANHVARKAKEPPKLVLPRFRGFRVDLRQVSRLVRLR